MATRGRKPTDPNYAPEMFAVSAQSAAHELDPLAIALMRGDAFELAAYGEIAELLQSIADLLSPDHAAFAPLTGARIRLTELRRQDIHENRRHRHVARLATELAVA